MQRADLKSTSKSTVSTLYLDGEEWDLSNLCFHDNAPDVQNETESSSSSSQIEVQNVDSNHTKSKRTLRDSLYPTRSDVTFETVKLKPVEDIFCVSAHQYIRKRHQRTIREAERSARRANINKKMVHREESRSRVGAFADPAPATTSSSYKSSSTSPKKVRPPPPTWVSDDTLEEKFDQKKIHDASRECRRSRATSSLRERSVSPFSVSSNYSTFSSDVSDDESITRPEIEVLPGKFLPLRGAVETMEAINNGTSRVVSCLACQITLHCIQDAEMVICPDCRNISPVVTGDDDVLHQDTNSVSSYCERFPEEEEAEKDDDSEYHIRSRVKRKDRRKTNIGGVGLGLKADS